MSELLKAVRDCSIDFSAQLFAREAFLSSPERLTSAPGSVPAPSHYAHSIPVPVRSSLSEHLQNELLQGREVEMPASQQGKGVRALLPAFFHLFVTD